MPGFPAWIRSSCVCVFLLCCPALEKAAFSRHGCTEEGAVTSFRNPVCFIQYYCCSMHRTNSCCSLGFVPLGFLGCPQKKLSLGAPGRPGGPFWYLLCRWCHLCSLTHPSAVLSPKFLLEFNPCGHHGVGPTVPITSSWDLTANGQEPLGVPLPNQFSGKWGFCWWRMPPSAKSRGFRLL